MPRMVLGDCVLALHMDEGAGDPKDYSGIGNVPTNVGADWVTGYYGNALSFVAANNDRVTIPHNSELNLTGKFTILAWINPVTLGGLNGGCIFQKLSHIVFGLWSNNNLEMSLYYGGAWHTYQSSANVIVLNKWQHVSVTFDNTLPNQNIKFYVNGASAGTADDTNAPADSVQSMLVGNDSSLAYDFNGIIDELYIYKARVLSQARIQKIWRGSRI